MIEITITNDMPCAELTNIGKRLELVTEAHEALNEALADLFAKHRGFPERETAKTLAKEFDIPKRVLNRILKNEGWQVKDEGEWVPTFKGFELGGAETDMCGRGVTWHREAVYDLVFANE